MLSSVLLSANDLKTNENALQIALLKMVTETKIKRNIFYVLLY